MRSMPVAGENVSVVNCCGSRQIEPLKHKGKDALSLNAFIYRERELSPAAGAFIKFMRRYAIAGQAMDSSARSSN